MNYFSKINQKSIIAISKFLELKQIFIIQQMMIYLIKTILMLLLD